MQFKAPKELTRGFLAASVLFSIAILGAMGAGLSAIMAANQKTRVAQINMDQAFFSSHAALEFAMRSIVVDGVSTVPTRQFVGYDMTTSRANNKINVAITHGSGGYAASNSFSINDPSPSNQASCLVIDTSSPDPDPTQLAHIMLSRKASCAGSITIVAARISWTPNNPSQKVRTVQIKPSPLEYNAAPLPSGSIFPFFLNVYTINDALQHEMEWDYQTSMPTTGLDFTLVLYLSDLSSKTASIHI